MAPDQRDHPLTIEEAILRTVAYGDVFDSPLRVAEVHRYLEQVPASLGDVDRAVDRLSPSRLARADGFVCLPGRESLVRLRRSREAVAADLWPAARRCARAVSQVPWVRMVALTGALAMDNVDEGADIDLLIVTEPNRVWLSRFLVVQQVRMFRARGVVMCPNWFLSAERLALGKRDLHTARELTQMVPLAGLEEYRRMRGLNRWTEEVLPNAAGPPRSEGCAAVGGTLIDRLGRTVLDNRIGDGFESWMAARKIREIRGLAGDHSEVILDRHQCKGHVGGHGRQVAEIYLERLRSLSLAR